MQWNKVTLVGVGLLGGSLGMALRNRKSAAEVAGFVRRKESAAECLRLGAVDSATTDLSQAVSNADLIVLCTPVAQMPGLVRTMLPALKPGALITDVGSVKQPVVKALEPLAASAAAVFIGSHPMTGSERMGAAAARSDLFCDSLCIVTPTSQSPPDSIERIEQLWQSTGARTLRLPAAFHDELAGRSSHLPHVAAAALATLVLDPALPESQPLLCANGFRDTTRVASGSPEMWRDIAMNNRDNLLAALAQFSAVLSGFERALRQEDAEAVEQFFREAKQRRDRWRPRNSGEE